jgi:hypothetical protein
VTRPERWAPDEQLIPAFLANHKPEVPLSPADKCWVVAGLSRRNVTAEAIAELLNCSLRLVRTIRAEPMTQVCLFYMQESEAFDNELRLARSENSAVSHELAQTAAELKRVKTQLANLLGPRQFRCGHPINRYNVYEHNGRRYCRQCHCKHSAASRARKKTPALAGRAGVALTMVVNDAPTSNAHRRTTQRPAGGRPPR